MNSIDASALHMTESPYAVEVIAPHTPISAPREHAVPRKPFKIKSSEPKKRKARGSRAPKPSKSKASKSEAPVVPEVEVPPSFWPIFDRDATEYNPNMRYTRNWKSVCLSELSPADAADPEKTSMLPVRAGFEGPFFHLGEQRYTKNFYEYVKLHYLDDKTEASRIEKAEYEAARGFSTIKCDCCYLRSINQSFASMHTLCPLCQCETPKCDGCRNFKYCQSSRPGATHCYLCGSRHV